MLLFSVILSSLFTHAILFKSLTLINTRHITSQAWIKKTVNCLNQGDNLSSDADDFIRAQSLLENDIDEYSIPLGNVKLEDISEDIVSNEENELVTEAMKILDCLTSPKDPEDLKYDVDKDVMRDQLLLQNNYETLKVELRTRGLKTSGDKLEMMIRLLVHIIDPTINYSESSGQAVNLKYIDEEDIRSQKAKLLTKAERERNELFDLGPDADDLSVLKKRRTLQSNSPNKRVFDHNNAEDLKNHVDIKPRSDDKPKIVSLSLSLYAVDKYLYMPR